MTRAPRVAARTLVALLALLAAACRPGLMDLPSGASTAVDAAEATAALGQATSGCAAVRALTAEVAVSGSAGGRRLRGRLLGGVAKPASVRLEAVAPFGQPLFIFVATGDSATLLLPRDDRVLEDGRPAAVLEAVAGVPLDAADLETALTGCAPPGVPPSGGRRFGESWMAISDPMREMYLRRNGQSGAWELVARIESGASSTSRWRAEFSERQAGVPRAVRVTSLDEAGAAGRSFDLRLALSGVEINTPLGPEAFSVRIPSSATPITIEELRASGPLAP